MKPRKEVFKNCEQSIAQLIQKMEYGPLQEGELEQLYQEFPDCKDSIAETYQLWQGLSDIEVPVPRPQMHRNFYTMLQEEADKERQAALKTNSLKQILNWLRPQGSLNWGMVMGLFLLGFLVGQVVDPFSRQQQQIDRLTQEINLIKNQNNRLPDQESVSDRMKGVQMVRNMAKPNLKIFEALNQALLNDPNVNVRLSAIESLLHFADEPIVRKYLIQAIPVQTSPLVQLELAEAMIQLEEKGSADAWKQLLESEDMDLEVKMHLEEKLETIL